MSYRCVFLHNMDSSRTLYNTWVWIPSESPKSAICSIGADPTPASPIGSTTIQAMSIGVPYTAPAGVTFLSGTSKSTGAYLGNIPAGACRAVWIRRQPQGSQSLDSDNLTIKVEGQSEQ